MWGSLTTLPPFLAPIKRVATKHQRRRRPKSKDGNPNISEPSPETRPKLGHRVSKLDHELQTSKAQRRSAAAGRCLGDFACVTGCQGHTPWDQRLEQLNAKIGEKEKRNEGRAETEDEADLKEEQCLNGKKVHGFN